MEYLIIVILVFIFIYLTRLTSTLKGVENTQREVYRRQRDSIKELKELISSQSASQSNPIEKPIEAKEEVAQPPEVIQEKPKESIPEAVETLAPVAHSIKEVEPVTSEKSKESAEEEEVVDIHSLLFNKEGTEAESQPQAEEPVFSSTSQERTETHKKTFMERNPDLEKFIGENLINKVGIAILVLGIGFFVKYAIDQHWINEYGRVGVGVLSAGIMHFIAHRLSKVYKAFSSVLFGGGIAVLYFTIGIAFQEYQIFNQTTAFVIMVLVTGYSVFLSVKYDKMELAILSLIGGFATPLMASTGGGNYVILFSYIAILNTGMLLLAWFKKWNPVNIICFAITLLIFGFWFIDENLINIDYNRMKRNAFIFSSVFFLQFLLMNLAHHVHRKTKIVWLDISILLINTSYYFGIGMQIIEKPFQGLFTLALAAINLTAVLLIYKNEKIDKNITYFLIGITLTFVSLTAPIQLTGHNITIFWSAELVLLYWLFKKSNITLLRKSVGIISILILISIGMDWQAFYLDSYEVKTIFINKGFVTTVLATLAFGILWFWVKDENKPFQLTSFVVEPKNVRRFILGSALLLLYTGLYIELHYQLITRLETDYGVETLMAAYTLIVLNVLWLKFSSKQHHELSKWFLVVNAGFLVFYLLHYNLIVGEIVNDLFRSETSLNGPYYGIHFINIALIAALLYRIIQELKKVEYAKPELQIAYNWIFVSFIVILASSEVHNLSTFLQSSSEKSLASVSSFNLKIILPLLWGILSFVFMYLGMMKGNKHFRIAALALFALTILKLLLFDLKDISEGGKIAVFISLGVLLLIISFMYQKLKKLIFDEENERVE